MAEGSRNRLFAYHAVPTNSRALHTFRHRVTDLWRRSLRRRSQRDRMTWSGIKKLADDFLPQARILHPWPHARFAVLPRLPARARWLRPDRGYAARVPAAWIFRGSYGS